MKNSNVIVALIIGVSLVICSAILSGGLKSLAGSIRSTGSSIGDGLGRSRASIPTKLWIDVGEIKLSNGGGGGQGFRIATVNTNTNINN